MYIHAECRDVENDTERAHRWEIGSLIQRIEPGTHSPPTKSLDFRRFDSSRLLIT